MPLYSAHRVEASHKVSRNTVIRYMLGSSKTLPPSIPAAPGRLVLAQPSPFMSRPFATIHVMLRTVSPQPSIHGRTVSPHSSIHGRCMAASQMNAPRAAHASDIGQTFSWSLLRLHYYTYWCRRHRDFFTIYFGCLATEIICTIGLIATEASLLYSIYRLRRHRGLLTIFIGCVTTEIIYYEVIRLVATEAFFTLFFMPHRPRDLFNLCFSCVATEIVSLILFGIIATDASLFYISAASPQKVLYHIYRLRHAQNYML